MSAPRTVTGYRILKGQLVALLACGHAVKRDAPPRLDLRTLPRTVATCAECDAQGPAPKRAA